MISFTEAENIVLSSAILLPQERISFQDSLNRVLAEDLFSDVEMPPFNKSAMDGFALRREDLSHVLEIIETIPAGRVPVNTVGKDQCAKVMTGSMIPDGADCVILIEESVRVDDGHIRFTGDQTHHNICYQGEDVRKGQQVISKGTRIRPQHIAILASTGNIHPLVYQRVKVGILTTGDELVEPAVVPGLAQIRNSNAWQLSAQCADLGVSANYYGIINDHLETLTRSIEKAVCENEIILLTGGVSMGEFDLVPEALEKAGFKILFRKIAVQPGRPTLFATKGPVCCFGLPGNPVSSFVQFEMLVKPLAWLSMGYHFKPDILSVPLGKAIQRKAAGRLSLIPVAITNGKAWPLQYHGSAHIHAYTEATGILSILPGITALNEGERVDVRFI